MRILVTGGAGFIGSHLVEHYQGRAEEVRVLDNFSSGSPANLSIPSQALIRGSVTDRVRVREAMQGVDTVFHLAALISVAESMEHPEETVYTNLEGTRIVLEEAAAAGVRKLVFASSAAVYGSAPSVPQHEQLEPRPESPYAMTKLEGERLLQAFHAKGIPETAALRFFNVFGPRQNPQSAYAAVVPSFLRKAMANETISVYGDGAQTRDFIYVRDLVEALAFAAGTPAVTGVYNAGYGEETSINDLAQAIVRLTRSSSKIRHAAPRPGDVLRSRACTRKLRDAGWQPVYSREDGLAATWESLRESAVQSPTP